MAFTLIQLQTLERAIAQGQRVVEYVDGGRSNRVEYRTLSEMLEVRAIMRRELGVIPSGILTTTPKYRSGL